MVIVLRPCAHFGDNTNGENLASFMLLYLSIQKPDHLLIFQIVCRLSTHSRLHKLKRPYSEITRNPHLDWVPCLILDLVVGTFRSGNRP